ncbi:ABC transporter ATP-binding protein uup [Limihaloglobus sulfuriphilus]|uniref:ATP-binding protein Uup n=1 Tax=Limihaloglobus sulfuriphilus TaxID=1851148 RepID=A0A1Q2MIS2_9BACT|nr:ATP-binding cassette domain-containing protein [Limihaloglobus sulfuriphilus]AQQ72564.1 ABC transporter ATP-binding protein uup [Limihaloglobus sulfuriphilus]
MAQITISDMTFGFGEPPLFDGVNFNIESRRRICLLGRNGSGKTTLLKLIEGELEPLAGSIIKSPQLKIERLHQQVPPETSFGKTVYEMIIDGHGEAGRLIGEYHRTAVAAAQNHDEPGHLEKLEKLAARIEACGGWSLEKKVEATVSKMRLEAEALFDSLSAGLKRRVFLARAIINDPDVLLLDEPTNHLDVESVEYLEKFLLASTQTIIFVTHDRAFLRKIATQIVEIDRGRLISYECNYDEYLRRRDAAIEAELANNQRFDKLLAQEEAWIRRGIQGRRTRNEGRVRNLIELRNQRSQRRNIQGKAKISIQDSQQSGQLVAQFTDVSFRYPETEDNIIEKFTTLVLRGDKIGVIGPNGCGKTTLLRLILGQLNPTEGGLKTGKRLETVYFDQLHAQLEEDKSVLENVADGYQTIIFNGKTRSVIGYLQDFLFDPKRARGPVSSLSGGERNRLLLAKMFAKPSNMLVLDEPTNDLDMETLELLEELIADYPGTVLIVSHDREFLNNTVTCVYSFEGDAKVKEYAGGYDDYKYHSKPKKPESPAQKKTDNTKTKPKTEQKKLSYNEQREFDAIPDKIEELESQIAKIHADMADPEFFKSQGDKIAEKTKLLEELETQLENLYNRWQQLEEKYT